MYTHLAVVLLLAVLIDTAAATGPPMDLTLPAVPMGSYYPDPDGILDSVVYDLCFMSCPMGMCTCFVVGSFRTTWHAQMLTSLQPDQLQRNAAFPLGSLYMDPGWSLPQYTHTDFVDPQENPHTLYPSALIGSSEHTDSILGGQQGHVHAAHNESQTESQTESQPESLPPNTIVSPATTNEQRKEMMRELEKDATRVEPSTVQSYVEDIYTPGDRLRQRSSKRQRPQSNGFPCGSEGCSKIFSRACDVK